MADFLTTVEKFINEKGFDQKLSSFGRSEMAKIGKKLKAKEITVDQAIDALCKERNYSARIGRNERSELAKRLK
jgi:hypothetical protein